MEKESAFGSGVDIDLYVRLGYKNHGLDRRHVVCICAEVFEQGVEFSSFQGCCQEGIVECLDLTIGMCMQPGICADIELTSGGDKIDEIDSVRAEKKTVDIKERVVERKETEVYPGGERGMVGHFTPERR